MRQGDSWARSHQTEPFKAVKQVEYEIMTFGWNGALRTRNVTHLSTEAYELAWLANLSIEEGESYFFIVRNKCEVWKQEK